MQATSVGEVAARVDKAGDEATSVDEADDCRRVRRLRHRGDEDGAEHVDEAERRRGRR